METCSGRDHMLVLALRPQPWFQVGTGCKKNSALKDAGTILASWKLGSSLGYYLLAGTPILPQAPEYRRT